MVDGEAPGRQGKSPLVEVQHRENRARLPAGRGRGEERPVILVIDLRDKMGFDLASRLDPKQTEQVRDECNRRGVIPTALLATPCPRP